MFIYDVCPHSAHFFSISKYQLYQYKALRIIEDSNIFTLIHTFAPPHFSDISTQPLVVRYSYPYSQCFIKSTFQALHPVFHHSETHNCSLCHTLLVMLPHLLHALQQCGLTSLLLQQMLDHTFYT